MNVLVTGATGLIGRNLCKSLLAHKYSLYIFTGSVSKSRYIFGKNVKCLNWFTEDEKVLIETLNKCDAVIHLAGENIGNGIWTKSKKEKIVNSRVKTGEKLTELIQKSDRKIKTFIQASAIGIYGNDISCEITEDANPGNGFLADVCQKWEDSTSKLESIGIRLIVIRSGVVLHSKAAILQKLILPFRFFFGGHIGNGKHFISWIHIEDEIRAIIYLLQNAENSRVFNLTAANPVDMQTFCKTIGKILNRPSWFHVPKPLIKMVFGEMADEMLLANQQVIPQRLVDADYKFIFPEIEGALKHLLSKC